MILRSCYIIELDLLLSSCRLYIFFLFPHPLVWKHPRFKPTEKSLLKLAWRGVRTVELWWEHHCVDHCGPMTQHSASPVKSSQAAHHFDALCAWRCTSRSDWLSSRHGDTEKGHGMTHPSIDTTALLRKSHDILMAQRQQRKFKSGTKDHGQACFGCDVTICYIAESGRSVANTLQKVDTANSPQSMKHSS